MGKKPPAVIPQKRAVAPRPAEFDGLDSRQIADKMGKKALEVVNSHLEEQSLDAAKFILSKLVPTQVNHHHSNNMGGLDINRTTWKVEVSWGGDE